MRLWLLPVCLSLALAATGCADDDPEPAGSNTSASEPEASLVVDRRPATAAEHDRIDDDEGTGVLGCEGEGDAFWDYGPVGPDTPRGRKPDDALRDAIRDINEDRGRDDIDLLPTEGWVELDDNGQIWFLLADGDDWRALVSVGGDAKLGVWRHNKAILCP